MRLVILLVLAAVSTGCGSGICGAHIPEAEAVESPCGIDVFYVDGVAYTTESVEPYHVATRYFPVIPSTVEVISDGCRYELSAGLFAKGECVFLSRSKKPATGS